ncbi:hypothetical protein O181_054258 [Austropuccinia psidii MF-1]|uniref:Beta-mannosidase A n=1 Tax=Austropuccinia psidii MF-1 TaxID=1389203 RepID=A0A9Q3E8Z9_9BASI|nr:hypothetical protein [Austropuccinia psidii MF-1]
MKPFRHANTLEQASWDEPGYYENRLSSFRPCRTGVSDIHTEAVLPSQTGCKTILDDRAFPFTLVWHCLIVGATIIARQLLKRTGNPSGLLRYFTPLKLNTQNMLAARAKVFLGLLSIGSYVVSAQVSQRGPPLPASHLSLSSLNWTLSNANRSITIPTPFLNQAHLALIDAGIIDEPNIGLNEGTTRWVGEEEAWTWQTTFQLAQQDWSTADRFYLVFKGLDTFCEIELAGQKIGSTNNSFRSWVFDVTSALKDSRHRSSISLSLKFASAWTTATRIANEPPQPWYSKDVGYDNLIDTYEYDSRNWVRKQQSDFGWDWGPAYLPCGPLQPAFLIGLPGLKGAAKLPSTQIASKLLSRSPKSVPFWIHRTTIDIYRKGQRNNLHPDQNAPWILNVTLPITSTRSLNSTGLTLSAVLVGTSVRLEPKTLSIIKPADYINLGPDYSLTVEYTIDHQSVELWYPATLGNPKLYDLELTLDFHDEHKDTTQLTWHERVGFRTIVVDQSRYSDQEVSRGITPGTRFTYVINGKPFYVQGTSIIPIDTFAARTNSSTIRWLLQSVLLAHQNVIRIWGGGAYQTDEFYDICDELGILAWSEAVFACGSYPISSPSLIDNIQAEVAENVARLNRHPSTALWAGNNEGEIYLNGFGTSWKNQSVYFDEYDYLFSHAIRDVVLNNTRSISYIPSSTTQGYLTLDPYVSRYHNSQPGELHGDSELYNYNTGQSFDINAYPKARFVNEFGFHSMASIYTWDRILKSPEDYAFDSIVLRSHLKHDAARSLTYPWLASAGLGELESGVTTYYPTPKPNNDHRALLAQWAYSTQVFQAAFMASQIAYYRLGASRSENNMGAVYWQLNDVWEGTTWSSIEYTGRWKIFHYLAERVQDHVIISPIFDLKSKILDVYVTSDLWHIVEGTAQWTWYDFAGRQLSTHVRDFSISPLNSTHLYSLGNASAIVPANQSAQDAWLHLNLTSKDGKYFNEQFFHPVPLKHCKLRLTKVVSRPIGHNQVSLEIADGGGVAAWVNVEHPPGVRGYFKDMTTNKPSNAFFLRPNEKRHLEFVLTESEKLNVDLAEMMVVRTMADNLHFTESMSFTHTFG